MQKNEIKIGAKYLAKVTDKVVPIRIEAENCHGGWDATNLVTGKKVRVKSAQRLRPRNEPAPREDGKTDKSAGKEHLVGSVKADQENARVRDERAKSPDGMTASEHAMATTSGGKKDKGLSGLDAAAQVLKASREPMRCKDLVQAMLEKGLWATDGKTPAATIYSAILREIRTKGDQARFKKTDRGLFAANA